MLKYRTPVALRMRILVLTAQLKQAHASLNVIIIHMALVALLAILCVVIAQAHLAINATTAPGIQP
jgi:hypothetical protein